MQYKCFNAIMLLQVTLVVHTTSLESRITGIFLALLLLAVRGVNLQKKYIPQLVDTFNTAMLTGLIWIAVKAKWPTHHYCSNTWV